MLRGESVISGISTTGTGTYALAATPVPPGGVDLDVWARATGFGNSATLLLLYTAIEYSDSSFATAVQQEVAMGTLTLGGSAGIANCTLSRSTILHKITSMNSQPATYALASTAMTVGTAANTLVMLAPTTMDMGFSEFVLCDTVGDAQPSASDYSLGGYTTNNDALGGSSGFILIYPMIWPGGQIVTKAGMYCGGLAASSVIEAAIYHMTDHDTLKKIVDLTGSGANRFSGASTGYKQVTSFTPFYLPPGIYYKAVLQTGGAATWAASNVCNPAIRTLGTTSGQSICRLLTGSGQTSLPASFTISSSLSSGGNWASQNNPHLFLGW